MSPSPNPRPVNPPPFLVDVRVTPTVDVPAVVLRGLPPARLPDVERAWGPARSALAAAAAAAGVPVEHAHWDWRNKLHFYTPGTHCLVGVEAEGEVQGLMAVEVALRPSGIDPGRWVAYVDFIEVAPWNLAVPGVQTRRYGGVGTVLVGEAIRSSMGRAAGGRIGLHSLPGVEGFYAYRCRMTDRGPDPGYNNLVYFEYPDGVAAGWLTDVGYAA